MIGKHCWDIVHGTTEPIAECPILRMRRSLQRERMDMQVGERWFEVTVDPILDAEKHLTGAVHIISDITERKRGEASLEESTTRYRSIFESTGTATLLVAEDTTILMANQECHSVTGYAPEELIGQKWTRFAAPESLREMMQHHSMRRRGSAHTPTKYEVKLINRAQQVRDALLHVSMIPGTTESIVSILDITERVQAQEQLRRQNERLAILLEIGTMLAKSHSTRELFQAVVDGAMRLLPAGSAAVYRLQDDFLHLTATSPELPPDFPDALRKVRLTDHPHVLRAISMGSPVILDDTARSTLSPAEQQICGLRGLRSVLYSPLAHQGRPLGVLIAGSVDALHRFSEEEITLFRALASQVSLEIEGAGLLEANQRHIAELEEVTERQRRTEKALRESESLFRNLFEKHAAVKLVIDPVDGRIVDANEAASRFYGWSREELRRMKISDINTLPPAQVKIEMERVRAQERVYFEFKHRRADGAIRDVAVYSSKIESAGRDLLHSIIHDITERKRVEAERARLFTAIEQAGEVILITDPDGTIQYVNPAFTAVTGYSREEAIGRKPSLLKSGQQDRGFYQNLWGTITSGRVWQGRMVNKRKDGGLYTETATISPVMDSAGRILNFVAVKRDISEHLRAEEEQARLQEQLRQAQKLESVGRLAGGVAHDFNNMLGIILGYGEIALGHLHQGDPLRESLEEIVKAARRSAALTRQLLAFSRKQTLQLEVLDLNHLVLNLEKMLRRLIGEDIDLELSLGHDIGRVLVDPGQIEQVILNLAVNARDAMPSGGRLLIETAATQLDELYASRHPGVQPGDYVLLAVTDSGCGMSKEILAQIFDPFFTTKEKGRGTGLGLSTVYGIVKQSGGNIWVYSEPGRGTTFKVYLPQTKTSLEPTVAKPEGIRPDGGSEHVLVVEDEEALRKLMGNLLSRLGYKVSLAANGGEALLLVEEQGLRPDLVITDVVMPNMSGKQLIDRLSRIHPHLKVLYMSGYTDNAIVHHGVLEPGTPFIQKPFTLERMAAEIRMVLGTNRR